MRRARRSWRRKPLRAVLATGDQELIDDFVELFKRAGARRFKKGVRRSAVFPIKVTRCSSPKASRGRLTRGGERARQLISEADDKTIVDQVVKDAKANNPAALALYFRFLRPPAHRAKPFIEPIDYMSARRAILEIGERLAKGELQIELHDAWSMASKPISAIVRSSRRRSSLGSKAPYAEATHELREQSPSPGARTWSRRRRRHHGDDRR
jgi:hypothetical protein